MFTFLDSKRQNSRLSTEYSQNPWHYRSTANIS